MTSPKDHKTERLRKRTPRKATPKYLDNAALYYLSRYATSAENLKRVMMRKVDRSAQFHGTDAEEGRALVEDMIKRFKASALLDDAAYARTRAASLHARGNSAAMIRAKLKQKGLSDGDIQTALAALGGDATEADFAAALNYAKRRRFGPFAAKKPTPEQREKQLAAMARAGFSYDIARQALGKK